MGVEQRSDDTGVVGFHAEDASGGFEDAFIREEWAGSFVSGDADVLENERADEEIDLIRERVERLEADQFTQAVEAVEKIDLRAGDAG